MLAVAGTDTDSIVEHVRGERDDGWIVVNDVVAAWATRDGRRAPASRRSRGPARTSSASAPTGAAGAPAAGGICSAMRALATGWAWSRSRPRCATARLRAGDRAERRRARSSSATASVEALANRVYSKPLTKGEIAAFAIETAKLAEQGDAVARELYERGASELGQQIAAVIRESGLAGAFPVGLIGSAFKAGAVFVEPLSAAVHAVRAAGAG